LGSISIAWFATLSTCLGGAILAHSLQRLAPVYREALVLRFQEDLSLQEIAGIVGASVSTVASRIYRGLAALRAEMEGEHAH
jgi:RNA polymerase sigma-70 factor, ECF subfamily